MPNGAPGRRLPSQEEINKRLSLPADLKLPENFVEKQVFASKAHACWETGICK
jgi:hypothetical protein